MAIPEDNLRRQVLALIANHRANVFHVIFEEERRVRDVIMRRRRDLNRRQQYLQMFINEMFVNFAQHVPRAVDALPLRVRTIGRRERSEHWWTQDVLENYTDDQWIEDFRMRRATFFQLADLLRDSLQNFEGAVVPGLTVEKRVAIAIYKLASCAEYRAVGKGFGVAKSTVCDCVHSVCKAIIKDLGPLYLKWPTHEQCKQISVCFERKYNLPQVIGAIDGTHIPITPPEDGAADFTNRKSYASIVVQAVVDHRRCFLDVTAQHPGCTHDASVLRDSNLYRNHENMFPQSTRTIDGAEIDGEPEEVIIPYCIVGDPAYPLSSWLLKNYPVEDTPEKVSFNLHMNSLRIVVEHAFGRLKSRWRILSRKSDLDVYNMPHVIVACCILHNFVERAKEDFLPLWREEMRGQREQYPDPEPDLRMVVDDPTGVQVRNHLCAYMARNYPLLTR